MTSNKADNANALSNSPFDVSNTIAVVNTRVCPLIFPPTIIEAPTSEITEPKPAMSAARSGSRASRQRRQIIWGREAPSPSSC